MKNYSIIIVIMVSTTFSALTSLLAEQTSLPKELKLRFVESYPHDTAAYTQGLFFENGYLFESTGLYGSSTLRKVDYKTGVSAKQISVPQKFFAEGIERIGDKIFMLTWREGFCFVFDKNSFTLIESFRYTGEGWGITSDGENLFMSDGSSEIRVLDSKTFKVKRKIQVTEKSATSKKSVPVMNLNELEYVRGEIWANIWQTTRIIRIDPKTGNVIGSIDCSSFVPKGYENDRDRVLNGIAFDTETDRLFITGKCWNVLYEMKIE